MGSVRHINVLVFSYSVLIQVESKVTDSQTCCLCQINMNIDIRLIQVNERMVKHKLLVAVADWVQNCTGNMQVVLLKPSETVRI